MKKLSILTLSFLFLLFSCSTEVVIDKDAEAKAIQEILDNYLAALAIVDIETMKSLTTDDFLAFDVGNIWNNDELASAIQSFIDNGLADFKFSTEPVKFEIYSESAFLSLKNTGTGKMNDQDMKINFIESAFFEKFDDGWKMKFYHSTEIPPPPPKPEIETE